MKEVSAVVKGVNAVGSAKGTVAGEACDFPGSPTTPANMIPPKKKKVQRQYELTCKKKNSEQQAALCSRGSVEL